MNEKREWERSHIFQFNAPASKTSHPQARHQEGEKSLFLPQGVVLNIRRRTELACVFPGIRLCFLYFLIFI